MQVKYAFGAGADYVVRKICKLIDCTRPVAAPCIGKRKKRRLEYTCLPVCPVVFIHVLRKCIPRIQFSKDYYQLANGKKYHLTELKSKGQVPPGCLWAEPVTYVTRFPMPL